MYSNLFNMYQATLDKFQHPSTLIKEYEHWLIVVRPRQVTLGSLVLICKDEAERFSEVSAEAFAELKVVISEIENNLKQLFNFDKINYLMLMMVDRGPHFHVIPRYEVPPEFGGHKFIDAGWPATPMLDQITEIPEETFQQLIAHIRRLFV